MSTVEMLRELEAKATPGEWIIDEPHQVFAESCGEYVAITGQIEVPERLANSTVENNAALIAAMRNAMPALLRVADAAKARFEVWTPETYQELKEALEALEEADNG